MIQFQTLSFRAKGDFQGSSLVIFCSHCVMPTIICLLVSLCKSCVESSSPFFFVFRKLLYVRRYSVKCLSINEPSVTFESVYNIFLFLSSRNVGAKKIAYKLYHIEYTALIPKHLRTLFWDKINHDFEHINNFFFIFVC